MLVLDALTVQLRKGADLDNAQSEEAAKSLASADISAESKEVFLIALAEKGETAAEVAGFANVFRQLAKDPSVSAYSDTAIDIVGTGGDHAGSFNISTTVSFILAAAGVKVLKHGSRAITSKSGSADFLEAVGFDLEADIDKIHRSLEILDFCFFFAPAYHPAFKEIGPVRKALASKGQRSIFNIIGPLINPGRPAYQLLGVFAEIWVEPLAHALQNLGVKRGLVVHGKLAESKVMDELTCAGENRVAGVGELEQTNAVWVPGDYGLDECKFSDLAGGSTEENLEHLNSILDGGGRQGLIDTLLWNAGTALWIAGMAKDPREGIEQAKGLLLNGAVKEWLNRARDFYAST
jgi:anthranilate phosphoribosyltransferase